jgi:hypothetical protein
METDIETPKALILPICTNEATEIKNDVGYLAYCIFDGADNKLAFVTEKGVGGEVVTSV